MGHASIQTTMRYAHLAPENVHAAVARLDGRLARGGHGAAMEDETTVAAIDVAA